MIEPPRYVIWEVTRACNLCCGHCAASAGARRDGELSTDEALAVCDQLASLSTPAVCLMGGEVLLRRDWSALAERLRERGVAVGLITNGWRFDDDTATVVERLGICQVGTSIDGPDAALHDRLRGRRGAFERVEAAVARIAALPLAYRTVITSVNRLNLEALPAIRDWLVERAAGFTWMLNISSCHDAVRFDPHQLLDVDGVVTLARFIDRSRQALRGRLDVTATHGLGYFSRRFPDLHSAPWTGCAAGVETLGIRSNGDVTGCLVMDDSFIEGNLRQVPLVDLWTDPMAFAYNRRFEVDQLEGGCRGCDLGERCRGGCRNMAVSFTGSRFEYPFCLHRLEREGALGEGDP